MMVSTVIEYEDIVERGEKFNLIEDNPTIIVQKLFAQIMEKAKMMAKYYESELGKQ